MIWFTGKLGGVLNRQMRQARILVALVFATNGAVFGTWTPRIPTIQAELGLDEAHLGLALLGPPAGSVGSMMMTGALVQRFGTRRVTVTALAAFSLSLPLVGLAPSLPWLFAALLAWGGAMGALDVAMNTAGLVVQRGYGRPILAAFHAALSAGGLVGALIGAMAAEAHIPVAVHFTVAAVIAISVAALAARSPLPDLAHGRERHRGHRFLTPSLATLGALAFAGLLAEGATADWSAVYLTDTLGASPGVAGAGFVAFSITMTVGRLLGDRIIAAAGPVHTVRIAAASAATTLAVALVLDRIWAAVAAFALLGAGLACVVPVVFTAAANRTEQPATAIAAVSTCGYLGFIAGPPIIGGIAAATSLSIALGLVAALTGAAALLAPAVHTSHAETQDTPTDTAQYGHHR